MSRLEVLRLRSTAGFFVLFCFQEIEVGGSRKAIIIFVPVPQLKAFQKIQVRLVRELEKKFSGKHVVFIAQVRKMCTAFSVRYEAQQLLLGKKSVFWLVVHQKWTKHSLASLLGK